MKILGISAFYHDSAAAIIRDGRILACAQEVRFTRKKHDPSFPANAIKFCMDFSGFSLKELDAVVFYEKPFLKFERLLETYYAFAPRGLKSFLTAMPSWLKEKLFLKSLMEEELKKIEDIGKKKFKLLFSEHHLSHAASAFYPSPFKNAAIVTIDGVGEWASASICYGDGNKIKIIKELDFPHSLGLLYSSFTYYLGFKVNSGEYKMMGLAPYGDPNSENFKRYVNIIEEKLVDIKEDGSIWIRPEWFDYATGLKMVDEKKWEKLFGFAKRKPESEIFQEHCDLALAIQKVTEKIIFKIASEAKKLTLADYLCLAGGVALNCVANGALARQNFFSDIFIQPAGGDAGGAVGCALAANFLYFNQQRDPENPDGMQGAYLGPEFSDFDIKSMAKKYRATYRYHDNFDQLAEETAEFLAQGKVVGWFEGRMEFGPRALGNRSILGDARNPEMQKRMNLKIKYRESFRPFAPSVLAEDASEYFELDKASPYMLIVADVKKDRRKNIPENYQKLALKERLYFLRSDIPAVTHVDFSSRIQTVHSQTNPVFWKLLNAFKKKTGYSVLVNTSFNVRGEPIVCTPDDAYKCFMKTNMDFLVMGNFLFKKDEQAKFSQN